MKTRFSTLLFLAACSYKIEGPTPVVTGAQNERDSSTGPAYLCNAQGDPAAGWLVDALGDKFAPLPTGALTQTSAGVAMPAVSVAGPESYTVPPAYVRFIDKTRMPLAMRTADSAADAHALTPGDYTITVTNLNGASGTSPAGALRVVPPPHITAVSLTASGVSGTTICADQPQTLTITGTNFRTDKNPTVTIGSHIFTGAVTATSITVTIPAGTFSAAETSVAGTVYTVTVTNPEGCAAPAGTDPIAAAQVTAFPTCTVLGTLSVSPRFGYQLRDTPVTITNNFTAPASQGFSGALPKVTIIAPLASGGAAQSIPLRSIAYVDPRTITAVVPVCSGTSFGARSGATPAECPGIAPGGPYDVQVVDPVSGQGKIVGAFTVVSNPPPLITNLNPGSISKAGGSVTVTGTNFDATSSVLLGTPVTGGVEFCTVPVSASPPQTTVQIAVSVPATLSAGCYVEDAAGNHTTTGATGFGLNPPSATGAGQYLVRVQHGSDVASGDFAALLVTNASFKPFDGGVAKSTMVTARGQAGAAIAFDDLGQPFLYVVGGSTNGTDALSSVEVAPVGLFGDLGGDCTSSGCSFRVLGRTPLPAARAGVSLVQRSIGGSVGTSYLYAIAGRTALGAPQATVSRAQVLRNIDAPTMRQITTGAGAGPGAGIWYYKVAALGLSPDVPETLPSDEESASLDPVNARATIKWGCVAGATGYRIYRNATAGGVSNSEVMLKDVAPSCSGTGAGTMTANDDGTVAAGTSKPLPHGALGAWIAAGALGTSRYDHQARTLPNANQDILVMGGCTAASGPGCGASTTSVEALTFANATSAVDPTIAAVGSGLIARDRFGAGIATNGTANVSAGKTFVLVFGGETNGTEISGGTSTVQVADIVAEGPTPAFTFSAPGGPNNIGVGGWTDIVANQGFSLQTKMSNQSIDTVSGSLGTGPFSVTTDFSVSFSNTGGVGYTVGGTRFLCGEQLFRAFIYLVGGFPNGAASGAPAAYAAPTNTVELFEY